MNGHYGGEHIFHPRFAQSPEHYVRAFTVLLKDLQELFDYIEPSDANLDCYSYRIHELLLRACVEVEANCKAILRENGYTKKGNWTTRDYRKIEASHRLSGFEVKLPIWHGPGGVRSPFADWASGEALAWYQAYNDAKHDRNESFTSATFGSVIDAVCAVQVLLSAQFYTEDFLSGGSILVIWQDDMEQGIGKYLWVKFPQDWPKEERYDFDWNTLKGLDDPFQNYPYKV